MRRPARRRGSFGQWSTADHTGAVRDHHGWDAATLAVIDGGGCLRPDHIDHDPNDTDDDTPDRRTGRRRTTTRTRKGGRQ